VAPAELVGDAARRLGPLAERSGIHLEVRDAGGLPAVRADRDRIAQVLANLVHNAIKFTPAGGTVTLGATADDGAVRFRVTDTGAGIARDELERVFERFFKGEPSRATGGTGLGLAIAKHIVIAHGGAIAAESPGLGRGSTFTFTLPVR
jgi:two-component system phosphate regulon sensor histidine kinase PhoR